MRAMPSDAVCTTSPFSSGVVCSALIQLLLVAFFTRTVPSMAVKFACCGPALICCTGGGVPAHFDIWFCAAFSNSFTWLGNATYRTIPSNTSTPTMAMITLRYVIVVQPIIDSDLRGDTYRFMEIGVRLPQDFGCRDRVIHLYNTAAWQRILSAELGICDWR